jgi:hypothetical protein
MYFLTEKEYLDDLKFKIDAIYDVLCKNHSNPEKTQWMDGKEVLNYLKISSRTLQNYRDKGLVGFSQIGTKKIQYSRESVEKLLQSNYVLPFKQKS